MRLAGSFGIPEGRLGGSRLRITPRSKTLLVTVFVFLSSLLLSYMYGVVTLQSPVSDSSAASLKDTPSPNLSVSYSGDSIDISDYTPNSTIASSSLTLSTTTNAPNGYNIRLNTLDSNTCLRHYSVLDKDCTSADTTGKKLVAGNLVGDNQWAWSSNNGATWILPQDDTGSTTLFNLTGSSYTNDERTITVGMKANMSVSSGTYRNSLVVTTTANYIPAPTIANVYRTDTTVNAIGPIEGGTGIDIIGTNLDTAYQVFIDLNSNGVQDVGEQCTSPNIVDSTKITCSSPAHTTEETRNVVVNTWGGSVTKTNGYEYGTYVEEIWGFTVDTSISDVIYFNATASVPLQVDFGNGSWTNFATGATVSGTAIPTTGVAPLSRIRVRPQDSSSYNWFPIGTETSSWNVVLDPINHLKTLDYPITTRSISNSSGSITKPLARAFNIATNLTTSLSFVNSTGVNISGSIGSDFLSHAHDGCFFLTDPIDLTSLANWNVTSIGDNFLNSAHRNNALTSSIDLTPLAGWSVSGSIGSNFLAETYYSNFTLVDPINLAPLANWNITSIGNSFLYSTHFGNTSLTGPINLAPLANWNITSIGNSFLDSTHYDNDSLLDISSFRLPNWAKGKIVSTSALYRTFYLSYSETTTGGEPKFMDGTFISSVGSPVATPTNRGTYTGRSSITTVSTGWK